MISMKNLGKKTLLDYRNFLTSFDLCDYNNNEELFSEYKNAKGEEKIFVRNKLVEANLPLVVRFLLDRYNYYFDANPVYDLDDVIQEANILLLESIEKYEYEKGSFSNYLYLVLQTRIYYANGIPNSPIYFDSHRTYRFRKIKKYIDLGYTDDEILSKEKISAKTLEQIKPFLFMTISIDDIRKREIDEIQEWVLDFIDYQDLKKAQVYLENVIEEDKIKNQQQALMKALEKLNASDKLLLTLIFGLDGNEPQKIGIVGKMIGIKDRYVYLKYSNALQKLYKNNELRKSLGYKEITKGKKKK